jgi:low temperature requirement protein LtrA
MTDLLVDDVKNNSDIEKNSNYTIIYLTIFFIVIILLIWMFYPEKQFRILKTMNSKAAQLKPFEDV